MAGGLGSASLGNGLLVSGGVGMTPGGLQVSDAFVVLGNLQDSYQNYQYQLSSKLARCGTVLCSHS